MKYMDLVKHLMGQDTFAFYLGNVDNSQNAANQVKTNTLLAAVHKKVSPVLHEMEAVMRAFDSNATGFLSKHDLQAACASLGVVLSATELDTLVPLLKRDEAGHVDYHGFMDMFSTR